MQFPLLSFLSVFLVASVVQSAPIGESLMDKAKNITPKQYGYGALGVGSVAAIGAGAWYANQKGYLEKVIPYVKKNANVQ